MRKHIAPTRRLALVVWLAGVVVLTGACFLFDAPWYVVLVASIAWATAIQNYEASLRS